MNNRETSHWKVLVNHCDVVGTKGISRRKHSRCQKKLEIIIKNLEKLAQTTRGNGWRSEQSHYCLGTLINCNRFVNDFSANCEQKTN